MAFQRRVEWLPSRRDQLLSLDAVRERLVKKLFWTRALAGWFRSLLLPK